MLCALLLRKDWGNSSEEKLCARLYFRKLFIPSPRLAKEAFFVGEEMMGRNDDDDAQRQKRRSLVFKERISSLLSEYFSHHGDVLEFVNSLTESCVSREQQRRRKKKTSDATMNNNNSSDDDAFILEVGEMVIAKAIRLSLDRGMKEREMCARLMERLAFGVCCVKGGPEEEKEETRTRSHSTSSSSSARVTHRQNHEETESASSNFYFPPEAFENAFDYLLSMLADVEIDVPKAMEDVSRFLARAVIDDVVSVTYLEACLSRPSEISTRGCECARKGKELLEQPGGDVVVRSVWGGEGLCENRADDLRERVKRLTNEYFQSLDCKECSRNLRALNVPYYHHEFVYRILSVAIERDAIDKFACGKQTIDVLKYLGKEGAVNSSQMAKGFARTAIRLRELALDYPNAPETFERLAETAKSRGLLPTGLSSWATLKTRNVSSHAKKLGLRKQLLRLDSAEDLLALAHENRRRYNQSPLGSVAEGTASQVAAQARGEQLSPTSARFRERTNRRRNTMMSSTSSAATATKALHFGGENTTSGDSGESDSGARSRSQSPQPMSAGGWLSPSGARNRRRMQNNAVDVAMLRAQLGSTHLMHRSLNETRGAIIDNDDGEESTSQRSQRRRRGIKAREENTWRRKFSLNKEHLRTLREMRARDNHTKHVAEGTTLKMRRRNNAMYYAKINEKASAATNNKPFLRRSHSAPGGLRELDELASFVSDVGKVHDYLPFNDRYEVGETMGKGGFAVVRKARHKESNEIIAVKTISIKEVLESDDDSKKSKSDGSSDENSDDDDNDDNSEAGSNSEEFEAMTTEEVLNELALMQRLSSHPHIVTIREFFTEQNGAVIHVVMDLLKGQELEDAVAEQPNGRFPEHIAKKIIHHLIDAVAFMHTKGVIHRDLKLENIVLKEKDDYDTATIVDFGLAKVLRTRQTSAGVDGTVAYVSPEALLQGTYGQGVDVWACGIALFVLLSGEWPFEDEDEDELIELICEANIDYFLFDFSGVSETAKDLLNGLLEPNPKRRLSAAAALEHEWFNPVHEKNDSQRLRRVHGKLEAYSYVEHQLPERRFEEGEYLCVKGQPCLETFLITSGECTVEEGKSDDETGKIMRFRRASNLVGEIDPDAETYSVSVKAKENTRALVFTKDDIAWANKRDYRLTQDFNNAIRERRRVVAKYEARLRNIAKQKERTETRHQSEFVRR